MNVLGIDIGGSGIKGAPVNILTGELLEERHRIETPKPATPDAVSNVVKQLIDHFNWSGLVGIGFPAAIQQGVVKTASNIDNAWLGVPINSYLSERTNCKVFAANDADVAGMAEMQFGAGKDKKGTVLLITVGTGIGTVIFIDGKLFPNTEIGHLQYKNTTIEDYASDTTRKKEDLSWKRWGKRFSEIINYYEDLLYTDLVIVGGGGSKKFEKYHKFLNTKTNVIPAELLNNAGIIGAALYAANNSKK